MQRKQNHLYDINTRKTLRYSTFNGVFASIMTGLANEYVTPFLLLLGGTLRQVGILHALPNIAAALVQLKAPDITESMRSRKKVVSIFTFIQGLIFITLTFLSLFKLITPYLFIGLMVFFSCCSALINPAWGSWLSHIVSEAERGRFFGWRHKTLGLITAGSAFLAGFILNQTKKINSTFYGFALLFGLAFMFRIMGWYCIRRMREPDLTYNKDSYFSFYQFLARLKQSNFAKFVLFTASMNFSVNLASPYFAVLMLRDLKFSYLLYSIITIASHLTLYLMMQRWGKFADRIGNLRIIRFTAPLLGVIPVLWIINRSPIFLMAAQIFSGFLWAGFTLCTSNFIYDAVTPEKRTRCIAYFNVLNGIALSLGAVIGGVIVKWLPELFGYKILFLFMISAFLRLGAGIFIPKRLKEVRPVEKINSRDLFFQMINRRPILGVERKTIRYSNNI